MLITLIGCGKMGSAMLKGWLNDPGLDADFAIVEPHQDALAWTTSYNNVRLFADALLLLRIVGQVRWSFSLSSHR